jgi:hypothetical protein
MHRVSASRTAAPIQREWIKVVALSVVVGRKLKNKILRAGLRGKSRMVAPKPVLAVLEREP